MPRTRQDCIIRTYIQWIKMNLFEHRRYLVKVERPDCACGLPKVILGAAERGQIVVVARILGDLKRVSCHDASTLSLFLELLQRRLQAVKGHFHPHIKTCHILLVLYSMDIAYIR